LVLQFHAALPEERYNEVMRQVFEKKLSPGEAASNLVEDARHAEYREERRAK
jgi:hypothetical protein